MMFHARSHPARTPQADTSKHKTGEREDQNTEQAECTTSTLVSRRAFLKQTGAIATATAAVAAIGIDPLLRTNHAEAQIGPRDAGAGTFAPLNQNTLRRRRNAANSLRTQRSRHWKTRPVQPPLANDDELKYPDGWANFSKTLPHDSLGNPDPAACLALRRACQSGAPADFAAIPLGGTQPLRNPQGGLSFEFAGYDSNQTIAPPAPAFASAWRAGEMVEVYWASLLRDVPLRDAPTAVFLPDPLLAQACDDLSALSDFRGPKEGGAVTPNTIFRGPYAGCEVGPYVSQFLLQDLRFGALGNTQQVRVFAPGIDYMTNYQEWLERQNGKPWGPRAYDSKLRYLRTIRDLAAWVDADPPLQAAYHALSILLQMGATLDPANPYLQRITNQDAFTTFGPVEWFDMIGRAPRAAHEAVWFQKWRIHRSLRPEEYSGRVHNHLTNAFSYPLHEDVLNSQAVDETFSRYGTYLCSQAYPDGSPTHTAYPSGHSVGVGSTVTMLKAIFDDSFVIPNPVTPAADGLSLVPFAGPQLTVGGELNKLAFGIGMARVTAGIHWRSDVIAGNALGEAVAIAIMQDMKTAYNEPFTGYTLTKFDGTTITI
jgi:membrane-associated phospholipid phosphatase